MDAQAFINDEIRDLGGQEYLDHNDPETVIRTLMRLMLPQENSRFRVGMSEQLYLWASPLYGGYGPDTLQTIEKILNRGLIESKSPNHKASSLPGAVTRPNTTFTKMAD